MARSNYIGGVPRKDAGEVTWFARVDYITLLTFNFHRMMHDVPDGRGSCYDGPMISDKKVLISSEPCAWMNKEDACTPFYLGKGLDIATFFYTVGDADKQDMWDSETKFLKTITGGVSTAGEWGETPETSGDRPIVLFCEYGFDWSAADKDSVMKDWMPESGISPLHFGLVPCWFENSEIGRMEKIIVRARCPSAVALFSFFRGNFSMLRHSGLDATVRDAEWQAGWLNDYDDMRMQLSVVSDMLYFVECYSGPYEEFVEQRVAICQPTDAFTLKLRAGNFIAIFITNLPHAVSVFSHIAAFMANMTLIDAAEFCHLVRIVVVDTIHSAITHDHIKRGMESNDAAHVTTLARVSNRAVYCRAPPNNSPTSLTKAVLFAERPGNSLFTVSRPAMSSNCPEMSPSASSVGADSSIGATEDHDARYGREQMQAAETQAVAGIVRLLSVAIEEDDEEKLKKTRAFFVFANRKHCQEGELDDLVQ